MYLRNILLGITLLCSIVFLFWRSDFELSYDSGDHKLYECYAKGFWFGSENISHIANFSKQCSFRLPSTFAPFTLLPLEYPSLSLILFSLPLLIFILPYVLSYATIVALTICLTFFILLRRVSIKVGLLFLFFICIGASTTTLTRFDIFPALGVLGMLLSVRKKQFLFAYLFLLLATMLKFYPIIYLLPLLFLEWRTQKSYRNFLGFVIVIGLYLSTSFFLSPSQNLFSHMQMRPIQIESMQASTLWLLSFFTKTPLCIIESFGSVNIIDSSEVSCTYVATPVFSFIQHTISTSFLVLFCAGYGLFLFLFWRDRVSFFTTCFALTLLLLGTAKVFSPQYVLWLLPFFTLTSYSFFSFSSITLFSLLTSYIFPSLYWKLIDGLAIGAKILPIEPYVFTIIVLRNGLLWVLLIVIIITELKQTRHNSLPDVL